MWKAGFPTAALSAFPHDLHARALPQLLNFTTAIPLALHSLSLLFTPPRCADRSLDRRSSSFGVVHLSLQTVEKVSRHGKDSCFAVWKAGATVENSFLPQSLR